MKTLTSYKKDLETLHNERAEIWSEYRQGLDFLTLDRIHERMYENAIKIETLIGLMIAEHPNRVHCYKTPQHNWHVRCGSDSAKNAVFEERRMAESYAKQWRKLGLNVDWRTLHHTWDPYNTRA